MPAGETKLKRVRRLGLNDDAMITGCCTAMRRVWRDFCLPFPAGVSTHDAWIGLAATTLHVRTIVDRPLQISRRHGANASNWMISDTRSVGILGFAKHTRLHDVMGRLTSEVAMLQALWTVFWSRPANPRWSGDETVAFWRLASGRLERTRKRIEILSSRQPARTCRVASFYLVGGYDSDHGWRSAASTTALGRPPGAVSPTRRPFEREVARCPPVNEPPSPHSSSASSAPSGWSETIPSS